MTQTLLASPDVDAPFRDIGPLPERTPQLHSLGDVPIVSADSHICLGGEDFWYENAPGRLKDRVPRILYREELGFWDTQLDGQSFYPPGAEQFAGTMELRRGGWDIAARMAELDGEGIDKEIAFPQNLMRIVHHKDLEVREYIFSEYNRYLSALQQRAPGRFYGVGVANYWDPDKARDSVLDAARLGLKAILLPCDPGMYPDGKRIYYSSRKLIPMWEAIEETGLTVCFHIAEGKFYKGGGALAVTVLTSLAGPDFAQLWGELVFGRVLDRHPSLRVAFVEANIFWVPGLLQHAEIVRESLSPLLDYMPKLHPREYWIRNCGATFMHDPAGLRLLDLMGEDTAMWSVDYPHNEGTFGYSGRAIDFIVEQAGNDTARKLVSENAMRFFRLD